PSQAIGVTLTDSWPGGFTRGATTTSQGSCTSGGGSFTCSLGDLAAGASATVSASYTVPSTAPAGTQTNTASVTSDTTDSTTSNNTAGDTTTVVTAADLAVTNTDGITTVAILRGSQTYRITVTNAGPSMAAGVILTDSWPSGFSRGTTTASQGSCTGSGGDFTCSLGNLAAGGSATITVNYSVRLTTLPGPQTNTVSVTSSTSDPNSSHNTASDTTTVKLLF
ncbi:MAG TPA: DUF11 domain-containing protein, partial [Terriglobia bacterium]|nr:DUF11 domain-containing protein [Terriglobia bacterium]